LFAARFHDAQIFGLVGAAPLNDDEWLLAAHQRLSHWPGDDPVDTLELRHPL
jgi:hypothetical protein